MDAKRQVAGQKLLDAAQDFWDACHEEGQYGAVEWLTGTRGELLIYTRGEYRERLLSNIETLPNVEKIHLFAERLPIDHEDD